MICNLCFHHCDLYNGAVQSERSDDMGFTIIDQKNWDRKEYFDHYFSQIPCTYSMTVKLDITRVQEVGQRLYPTMLYCLTAIVNRHEEFRMALNKAGEPGFYQDMLPCYTVFHKESETFSNLWTEYHSDYRVFLAAYEADLASYGDREGMTGKPDVPENSFPVSMLPWTTFEGFNLNLQRGFTYLTPIFTMGRLYQENGKTWLPLAIQVHHAVCDGFHVCRFVRELQELIDGLFGSGSEAAAPGGTGANEEAPHL